MALKKCKECGNEVSSSAKTCPKCGKKLKSGPLKIILIILGFFFLLGVIGSLSEESESEGAASSATTESGEVSAENVAVALNEEVRVGNFVYQVEPPRFKKKLGNDFVSKTADGIYLLIPISINNVSNKEKTLDGSMFKLVNQTGTEYRHSTEGSTAFTMAGGETIFLKQCQPNIPTSGVLVFEVPDEASKYLLQLSGGFWSGKTASVALN